jgi:hypothetical protein
MFAALILQGSLLVAPRDSGHAQRSHIELHKSAFVEFEHNVRALPEDPDRSSADAAVLRAVIARNNLGPSRVGAWLDPVLVRCANSDEFIAACAALPESVVLVGGGEIALRTLAVDYAKAMAPLEPEFLARTWPARERRIDAAIQTLREQLAASGDIALDQILRDLEISDPGVVIAVYFGTSTRPEPPPLIRHTSVQSVHCLAEHAGPAIDDTTRVARAADGSPVCFFKIDELTANDRLQMFLHCVTAALGLASHEQRSVLEELRERVHVPDGAWQPEWHVLISAESADVIRRVVDSTFVPEVFTAGFVDSSTGQASCNSWDFKWSSQRARDLVTVFTAWQDFLAGKRTRAEALDAIVAAGKAARPEQ